MQGLHDVSWKCTMFFGLFITGEDRYGLCNAVVSKGDNNDKSVLIDNMLFDQKLLTGTRKTLVWFWRSEYCPYGNYACEIPVTLFLFHQNFFGHLGCLELEGVIGVGHLLFCERLPCPRCKCIIMLPWTADSRCVLWQCFFICVARFIAVLFRPRL